MCSWGECSDENQRIVFKSARIETRLERQGRITKIRFTK
jgi:hypothetical protein